MCHADLPAGEAGAQSRKGRVEVHAGVRRGGFTQTCLTATQGRGELGLGFSSRSFR
jgi:hypothetical protein